jgi:UDP-glucose 4-epimerase
VIEAARVVTGRPIAVTLADRRPGEPPVLVVVVRRHSVFWVGNLNMLIENYPGTRLAVASEAT